MLQDAELSPASFFHWSGCGRVGSRNPSVLKSYQAKETVQSFCLAAEITTPVSIKMQREDRRFL